MFRTLYRIALARWLGLKLFRESKEHITRAGPSTFNELAVAVVLTAKHKDSHPFSFYVIYALLCVVPFELPPLRQ
jgi:hypothetical protein